MSEHNYFLCFVQLSNCLRWPNNLTHHSLREGGGILTQGVPLPSLGPYSSEILIHWDESWEFTCLKCLHVIFMHP